jgi:hypothetical protein
LRCFPARCRAQPIRARRHGDEGGPGPAGW